MNIVLKGTNLPTRKVMHQNGKNNLYIFTIGGTNNIHTLYHYLYDGATIFLDRKKARSQAYIEFRNKPYSKRF